MAHDPKPHPGWHLQRGIPVAFILAIVMQTAAFIWGAAKLDSRVGSIEHWITQNADTQRRLDRLTYLMEQIEGRTQTLEKRR
jgi:hypothetical protein